MKVTLADVAAAAGVSVPTVSKVVHGRADVAADTRSRVEAAAGRVQVRRAPSRTGAAPVSSTWSSPSELNPWAVEIINGAEKAAAAAGHRVWRSRSWTGKRPRTSGWPGCRRAAPNGVILVLAELPSAYRARLAALNVPVVIVDPVGQPDPRIPSVGAANWAGGLHRDRVPDRARPPPDRDHHRPAGAVVQPGAGGRLPGRARARGPPGRPGACLHRRLPLRGGPGRRDRRCWRWPTRRPRSSPGTTSRRWGSTRPRAHRLRIPDDLSVVGFDDLPMSAWVSPPLTTVAQPLAQMAAMATRMVLAAPAGRAGNRVELATSLVIRSSTAPPRAGGASGSSAARGPRHAVHRVGHVR